MLSWVHLCVKCSLGICKLLEETFSLSLSIVSLCLFALITEEGFLLSPCYSLELRTQIVLQVPELLQWGQCTPAACWTLVFTTPRRSLLLFFFFETFGSLAEWGQRYQMGSLWHVASLLLWHHDIEYKAARQGRVTVGDPRGLVLCLQSQRSSRSWPLCCEPSCCLCRLFCSQRTCRLSWQWTPVYQSRSCRASFHSRGLSRIQVLTRPTPTLPSFGDQTRVEYIPLAFLTGAPWWWADASAWETPAPCQPPI